MINHLKKYLIDNYFKTALSADQIDFIKTQNGLGYQNKKVVFYVLTKNQARPALVIYLARHVQANALLEYSISHTKAQGKYAPQVYFEDYYQGVYFAGLEFIKGEKFDLYNQTHFQLARSFLAQRPQLGGQNKSLADFYTDVRNNFSSLGMNLVDLVGENFGALPTVNLPLIKQHGDFQDNNLFVAGGQLKLIDWDDYGCCDWPLFDWLSLYLKYERKIAHDDFIKNCWSELLRDFHLAETDRKILINLYYLYDFLRKDKLYYPFERQRRYQALVDNLKRNL